MAATNPSWSYGIDGTGPNDLVAGTGIADMTFDNKDGEYSPNHESVTGGFEEGMAVRITLGSGDIVATELLTNGDLEDNSEV